MVETSGAAREAGDIGEDYGGGGDGWERTREEGGRCETVGSWFIVGVFFWGGVGPLGTTSWLL